MIIIKGGACVQPDGIRRADVALEGDRIAQIVARIEPAEGDQVVDAAGCWVLPGFIDAHTHLQCWTGMDWTADIFETGARAAACCACTAKTAIWSISCSAVRSSAASPVWKGMPYRARPWLRPRP